MPSATRGQFCLAHEDHDTLALILAGGSGTRMKQLTRWHAKPAIPFGAKYRTIDFSLSNCINSDIRRIGVLTQYKSQSLNRHIQCGWNFLRPELGEFIDLIPAQQRVRDDWYQGTADAVFQNLDIIREHGPRHVLVLAGDHVYKMDYRPMIRAHVASGAEVTVACVEVPIEEARGTFGVMTLDHQQRVLGFAEKPDHPAPMPGHPDRTLASMGIYVFGVEYLEALLREDGGIAASGHDFGHDLMPRAVARDRVYAYRFRDAVSGEAGYWQDVGSVDSYWRANLELLGRNSRMDLYGRDWPIWTYQEQLPPVRLLSESGDRPGIAINSLVAAGCLIDGGYVRHSVISSGVEIYSACVENSVILPNARIGRNCQIRNAVIDAGCNIPPGTIIGNDPAEDARWLEISPGGVALVCESMLQGLRAVATLPGVSPPAADATVPRRAVAGS